MQLSSRALPAGQQGAPAEAHASSRRQHHRTAARCRGAARHTGRAGGTVSGREREVCRNDRGLWAEK